MVLEYDEYQYHTRVEYHTRYPSNLMPPQHVDELVAAVYDLRERGASAAAVLARLAVARIKLEDGALYYVCGSGFSDCARLLCKRGAAINKASHSGITPLQIAAMNGHVDCVRLLCERGAAIDQADRNGRTPLHLVCFSGRPDIARLLCERGAAIDQADCGGGTPLLFACREGHTDVARVLCEMGASTDLALTLAHSKGDAGCVRVLEAAAVAIEPRRTGKGLQRRRWWQRTR